MDFFDSPLFWIVVIWWLLSTFLGAKARKRRALQRLTELEGEEDAGQPMGVELEEEVPESVTQPISPAVEYRDRTTPGPPRKAAIPKPPLQQLARSLGIPKEFIPSGILEEDEEPLPEIAATEPENQPEKETVDPAPSLSAMQGPADVHEVEKADEAVHGISHLNKSVFPSLTPLQQAIVLKEVLDRPRALRRGIR